MATAKKTAKKTQAPRPKPKPDYPQEPLYASVVADHDLDPATTSWEKSVPPAERESVELSK